MKVRRVIADLILDGCGKDLLPLIFGSILVFSRTL